MDKHFDFVFGSQNIDVTVDDNGTAWFQGPQIASILGYVLPSHMYRMLEANEIMTIRNVDGHSGQRGGAQMMNLINEFGVYRLIIARFFHRFVDMVLTSIHRQDKRSKQTRILFVISISE